MRTTVECQLFHGTAKIRMNQLIIVRCSDAARREWRPLCFQLAQPARGVEGIIMFTRSSPSTTPPMPS
jgi:hypothetical protein